MHGQSSSTHSPVSVFEQPPEQLLLPPASRFTNVAQLFEPPESHVHVEQLASGATDRKSVV